MQARQSKSGSSKTHQQATRLPTARGIQPHSASATLLALRCPLANLHQSDPCLTCFNAQVMARTAGCAVPKFNTTVISAMK